MPSDFERAALIADEVVKDETRKEREMRELFGDGKASDVHRNRAYIAKYIGERIRALDH